MTPHALQVIEPPTEEPVTLAEALRHLRIDTSDEDWQITTNIIAAREYAETFTGRQLCLARHRLLLDGEPVRRANWVELRLPRPPLRSVERVMYRDPGGNEVEIPADRYIADVAKEPGRLVLLGGWPALDTKRPGSFVVEYTAGYGAAAAVPAMLRAGMLLHVGHLFTHREPVVVGASVAPLPMAIDALYAQFRVTARVP